MDTYERKYKEAQKWIESIYPNLSHEQQMEAEAFFPELAESEDEKVRKGLINGFKQCVKDSLYPKNAQKYWHNVKIEDILAWLEKQKAVDVLDKEEKEFADNVDSYRKDMDEFYKKGYNAGREAEKQYWLEKQGEEKVQAKSLWHEYNHPIDKDRLFLLISKNKRASIMLWNGESLKSVTFGGGGGIILEGDKFAYIDELQEIQNPAEWSEEDEIKIKSIIAFLKSPSLCAMDGNKGIIDANIKYLKFLKGRVQPQNTWKPSEEQMNALWDKISNDNLPNSEKEISQQVALTELYEQLKKLKGE